MTMHVLHEHFSSVYIACIWYWRLYYKCSLCGVATHACVHESQKRAWPQGTIRSAAIIRCRRANVLQNAYSTIPISSITWLFHYPAFPTPGKPATRRFHYSTFLCHRVIFVYAFIVLSGYCAYFKLVSTKCNAPIFGLNFTKSYNFTVKRD